MTAYQPEHWPDLFVATAGAAAARGASAPAVGAGAHGHSLCHR